MKQKVIEALKVAITKSSAHMNLISINNNFCCIFDYMHMCGSLHKYVNCREEKFDFTRTELDVMLSFM